jgi:hypothetical protein
MNTWKISTIVLGLVVCFMGRNAWISEAHADAQPKMRRALEALQLAESTLKEASTDKGGHRVKALALTRDAIKEVRAGIAFDNEHDGEKQP